jgi:putative DNA primase/helicase
MFLGEGKNGKSTFLNLLKEFLGEENIATPSLHSLVENRFAKSELYGKLANIHGDLSAKKLNQTGNFKMLTGQDLIRGERKYQDSFTFRNYAKMIYSANQLPSTSDTTEAFFRRWIIVEFPYKFTEDPDDGHKDKNPDIVDEITSEEELSGFLNWSLEGLERLLDNGHFTKTGEIEDIKDEWLTRTNPLQVFMDKYTEVDRESFVTKDDFYDLYLKFCDRHSTPSLDKNVVPRRVPKINTEVAAGRLKLDGSREKVWKHLRFKEDLADVVDGMDVRDVRDKIHASHTRTREDDSQNKSSSENNPDIPDNQDTIPTDNSAPASNDAEKDRDDSTEEAVLSYIDEHDTGNGVDYADLINALDADGEAVESAINTLLSDGTCYEPKPGRIKML